MKLFTLAALVLLTAASPVRGADDTLSAAKDLYASAAYEDALSMLTRLSANGGAAADVALQIDVYRAFCLYALGRTTEAEALTQGVVRKDPLFQLKADEVSPRVDAMFTEVRRQLLPDLIRDKYRAAKASMDKKDYAAAEPALADVRLMVAQAEKLGVKDEAVTDLAIVADGFLDLARSSLAAKAAAAAPPEAPRSNAAAISPAPIDPLTIFDASATDVVPPAPIRQSLPPMPAALIKSTAGKRGLVQVTIEADGHVGDAVIREPVNSVYDVMVIEAARQWRYKPATKGGVAVRYTKAIALAISDK
jgi:TonB family protein